MNSKRLISTILLGLTCVVTSSLRAAEFCVTNTQELNVALFVAGSNGQSDHIKLKPGTYVVADNVGFIYGEIDSESHILEISGGWIDFFDNDCGIQLTGDPYDTVLDGNNQHRIFDFVPNRGSNIYLSHLAFLNGFQTGGGNNGGAIRMTGGDGMGLGSIVIENSVFINNKAFGAGSVIIADAYKIVFRNNIVVSSDSESGFYVVNLRSRNGVGIYATNNTIMFNSGGLNVNVSNIPNAPEASQAFIANNLLWGNDEADVRTIGNGTKFFYNNNYGIIVNGVPGNSSGNISYPPAFEPGILNFTPSINSPLVGAGRNQPFLVPIPTPFQFLWTEGALDVEGNVRNQGNRIDIGAVESPHEMFIEIPIFADGFE